MENSLLTSSQERSLHAALLIFEKALRSAYRMLSDQDEIGILYHHKSNLDIQSRKLIQEKIALTLAELEVIANKLGMSSIEISAENTIRAEMSISWESLEQCRSKSLRGYGELNPQAVAVIDPVIDHFARVALALGNLHASDSFNASSD